MSELNVVKKLLADKIDEMYVLRQENAVLKAEVASLRINQQPHGEICLNVVAMEYPTGINVAIAAVRANYRHANTLFNI